MKKRLLLFAMTAVCSTFLLAGCQNQKESTENAPAAKTETKTDVQTEAKTDGQMDVQTEAKTEAQANAQTAEEPSGADNNAAATGDLPALPAYGANPEYDLWTTLPYLVADAQMSFTATISADSELKKFEVQCQFFEDQIAKIEYADGKLSVTEDKTGFMKDIAPDIVERVIAQDIWLPISECTAEYGVFNDPGDNPIPVNEVIDDRPLYIQADAWEDDFTRANEHLNGLTTAIDDEVLAAYKQPCDVKGTVEAIEYDTYYYAKDLEAGDALSHKTPITKTAYVYLPAGYDNTKQYNILYLLHGGGGTAQYWFSELETVPGEIGSGYAVNILDHLFADKKAEPFIVVTPGLYNDADEQSQGLNGYTETFAYELRDLMPVVESTYATYAESADEDGLNASRGHRAVAGLSMGSITTWHSAVVQCLDVVSWFGNMSGGPSADMDEAIAFTKDKIIPAIEEGYAKGYTINMLLSMNGVYDIALEPHVAAHKQLLEFAASSDALSVGENYDFIVSDGAHTMKAWYLYLYDMAQVFFRNK